MNDPFVANLTYDLKLSNDLEFLEPTAETAELQGFSLKLEDGILTVTMKDAFSTEAEARNFVEPYLRSWELDIFFDEGRKKFWFEFSRSEIIDREPDEANGSKDIYAGVGEFVIAGHSITATVTKRRYPHFQSRLKYSPGVRSLVNRFEGYLRGSEPLLGMAYFCFSLLQQSADGRKKMSSKYTISTDVLDHFGKLTSEHGDESQARKIDSSATLRPLDGRQTEWVIQATKAFIRRKAEYDFDSSCTYPLIDFNSLPPLS